MTDETNERGTARSIAQLTLTLQELTWPSADRNMAAEVIDRLSALNWSPRGVTRRLNRSTILCATWWHLTPDLLGIRPIPHVAYEVSCALDPGHASPHVNLTTGDVRLGHEPFIAHTSPERVYTYIMHNMRDLHVRVPMNVGYIARNWWRHLAQTHDHRTCGICPTEVW